MNDMSRLPEYSSPSVYREALVIGHTPLRWPSGLGQKITVTKDDWDSFIADFSSFVQKYEILLTQLVLAQSKVEGFKEETQLQIDGSRQALNQIRAALDKLSSETEEELNEPD
jgi:hypothetical protein